MFSVFRNKHRQPAVDTPSEELSGVKKQSFTLFYNNGEIYCEHIDGMYEYCDLVLDKLRMDSCSFLKPSSPAYIAVILFDTHITDDIIRLLTDLLCDHKKAFRKVCFVGADFRVRRLLTASIKARCSFEYSFQRGIEDAKKWLLP